MRIALLGYGKMGRLIEAAALARGHEIVCRVTSDGIGLNRIQEADICIDFSHCAAVFEHLKLCALYGKNLVIGTTGWNNRLEEAKEISERVGIGVLYAPNCSIGIHLFLQMLESAAQLMRRFEEYDVGAVEMHHRSKKDTPSGTGLEIRNRLERELGRNVEIASVRLGSIPGTHAVRFDSPVDSITICHEARGREGFASGAVQAAEWLHGKTGFFTLEDWVQHA